MKVDHTNGSKVKCAINFRENDLDKLANVIKTMTWWLKWRSIFDRGR